jgi:hypothetical protein
MPNRRSPNQTLIAFALNRELLRAMDKACAKSGESRSTFIRQSLVAKIRDCRQPADEDWIRAQVRAPGEHRYVSPEAVAKKPRPSAGPKKQRATASARKPAKGCNERNEKPF